MDTNIHLFELVNAAPDAGRVQLAVATAVASWMVWLVLLAFAAAWVRARGEARRELVQLLLTAVLAWLTAELVAHVWHPPRPAELHLGTRYLSPGPDEGLPCAQVTLLWSLALAALATRHFAVASFPLVGLGLLVGVSRIYLGVQFPLDILAALPCALVAVALGLALHGPAHGEAAPLQRLYDRARRRLHHR